MGDYIKTMRKMIGHETLLTVGCGAIIENRLGQILLQKRTDGDLWGIPGGIMEIGETFIETVKREVFEETHLTINHLELFGLYSGANGFARYENGDKVFSVQIIFRVTDYSGNIQSDYESHDIKFFHSNNLPDSLNPHQSPFIFDWANGASIPIIK